MIFYTSYQVSSQLAFLVKEKNIEMDFQDGSRGVHLGFPIRTILAVFAVQVTLILPTKQRVI